MKMRLAGRRGEALEAFWAGKVDAQHALAQMRGVSRCAGGVACRCDGHIHAGEIQRDEPVKPAPRKCWLCDGLGQVITAVAEEGRRRGLPVTDGEVKAETCMACLGTGVER